MSVVDSSLLQARATEKVYTFECRPTARRVHAPRRWLAALCAASLLSGPLAFAAHAETGASSDAARPQTDHQIATLLKQVEQQISEGHTITPEGDNALVTWSHVLDLPTLKTPEARKALQDFAEQTRHSADTKQAAGDAVGASDFSVFSDQASKLLDRPATEASLSDPSSGDMPNLPKSDLATTSPPSSAEVTSTDVPGQPRKTETDAAPAISAGNDAKQAVNDAPSSAPPDEHAAPQVGPSASSAMPPMTPAPMELAYGNPGAAATDTRSTVTNAVRPSTPVAPTGNTTMPGMTPAPMNLARGDAPASVSSAPPNASAERSLGPVPPGGTTAIPTAVPTTTGQASPDEATTAFIKRGDAMVAIKDISAARKFYQFAANAGSARAATALGETYDPAFLSRLGAVGLKPNAAVAADWYRKAVALGDRAADDRLQALAMGAVK